MARPTFSNAEFADLLTEPATTPRPSTATTTAQTKSNETAAGGGRTAEGVKHHQRQAEKTQELGSQDTSKGDPGTKAGVEDGHQEAMLKAAAMDYAHNKARQELWEAVTAYDKVPEQHGIWEEACATGLQQMVEEYSPLLSTSFEMYYLCSCSVSKILVVNEARRRADDIFKFRTKKHKQRAARATRKYHQSLQHHTEVA